MGDHEAQGDAHLELRVSDAERDEIVGILREQTSAGRLTLEEFEQRLDEVYAARTAGALQHVLRELPVQPPPPTRTGPKRAEERTDEELRQRWRQRLRADVAGLAMPNVICNAIWVMGEFDRWWPGWVLLGTGMAFVGTIARGFDPDAERAKLAAEERARAMAEIEMRRMLGRDS